MKSETEHTAHSRNHDLTVEEVKACSLFANFTDEQALEVIETLKLFTKIAFDVHKKHAEHSEMPPESRNLKA